MHLVHLTIAPDCIISCLLDWTDSDFYVSGTSRDKRLTELWENYRQWCEEQKLGDRCQRRLFAVQTLKPDGTSYAEVSQKVLNATAARYMLFWLAGIATHYASVHGSDEDMCLNSHIINFYSFYLDCKPVISFFGACAMSCCVRRMWWLYNTNHSPQNCLFSTIRSGATN